jgi:hypothetical protein
VENMGWISEIELEHCKKQSLNNVDVSKAPINLIPAFSLNMFEYSKCTTTEVKLHTKQDLSTIYNKKISLG